MPVQRICKSARGTRPGRLIRRTEARTLTYEQSCQPVVSAVLPDRHARVGVPVVERSELASLTGTPVTTPTPAATTMVSAPPRCNFAGFCDYCGDHGCTNPRCIQRYAATWWAPCPDCDGHIDYDCVCTYGVVAVGPDYPGATRPAVIA